MRMRIATLHKALLIGSALCLFLPAAALSQTERSYHYTDFSASYDVHADSSVSVEETMTYAFTGTYHQGYRSIPHAGSSRIRVIRMTDATTGMPLSYSSKKLEKTDPSSWGKYTTYAEGGATIIEWYYDATDTTHAWALAYTISGAVDFYKDHDELYWDLFSSLDAGVEKAEATVTLPAADTAPSYRWYLANGGHLDQKAQLDSRTFTFVAHAFDAGEPATFVVGWQKGLVHEPWQQRLLDPHLLYLLAAAIAIIAIAFSFLYWLFAEGIKRGRGTVVAQYEPPQQLPPAIGSMLVYERLTRAGWAATIIDLAVKGHITIKEVASESLWDRMTSGTTYTLSKTTKDVAALEPYELRFLGILFAYEDSFSTKEFARSQSKRRQLAQDMKKLEKELREEIASDLDIYDHAPQKDYVVRTVVSVGVLVVIFGLTFFSSAVAKAFTPALIVLVFSIIFSAVLVVYIIKFETRLNAAGRVLREEWLGFKLYLKTAERYRLQNLTPETFERFLPYAMIFGIEKQWAKAFSTLTLPQPGWYHSTNAAAVGTFSPVNFTSSFTSNFTSSFASTGGGGASGGGGSAGGGGGGGGGGAS